MRLGVISDTHGTLPNKVFDIFSQVDHILHAGDIGSLDLLAELEALAPVTAVRGNTDGFDIRHRCPRVAKLELDGFYVTVTHGDQFGTPDPQALHESFPEAEIIVFGHTHKPLLELVDKNGDRDESGIGRRTEKGDPRVGRDHGVGAGDPAESEVGGVGKIE